MADAKSFGVCGAQSAAVRMADASNGDEDGAQSASKRLLLPRTTVKAARRALPGKCPTARMAARAALRALQTDGRRREHSGGEGGVHSAAERTERCQQLAN